MSNKADYEKGKSKSREKVSSQTLPPDKRRMLVKLKCYMLGEILFTESKKDLNRAKSLLTEAKCFPAFLIRHKRWGKHGNKNILNEYIMFHNYQVISTTLVKNILYFTIPPIGNFVPATSFRCERKLEKNRKKRSKNLLVMKLPHRLKDI